MENKYVMVLQNIGNLKAGLIFKAEELSPLYKLDNTNYFKFVGPKFKKGDLVCYNLVDCVEPLKIKKVIYSNTRKGFYYNCEDYPDWYIPEECIYKAPEDRYYIDLEDDGKIKTCDPKVIYRIPTYSSFTEASDARMYKIGILKNIYMLQKKPIKSDIELLREGLEDVETLRYLHKLTQNEIIK